MMKKVVIHSAGSYDKLKFIEQEIPTPKDNEVLIEVVAIGVNFADVCVRLGVYASAKEYVGWPITPGFEVTGRVSKVGPKVTKYSIGQEVVGFTLFNGYSTHLCLPEDQVLNLPKGFDIYQAAGYTTVFFTAYHALCQHIVLQPKSNILVHSAAGGVGSALVQLANVLGHKVTGVIGSSHKKAYLEDLSPYAIIDKSKEDLWKKAKDISPSGYHAIFDANGFSTMQDSYAHLSPTGKLIVYGSHDLLSKQGGKLNYLKAIYGMLKTPKFSPFDMISNNKGVIGFNLSFLFSQKEMITNCIQGLEKIAEGGKLRPLNLTKVKFEDVAKAHQLIESGQSVGKIILTV